MAAAALAVAHTGDASAQVLELGPDGAVTVFAGPTLFTRDGATPIAPPDARTTLAGALEDAGDGVALSPLLLEAVAWAESRFNAAAVSPKGAVGVMQLMPGTAAELGVDPHDPEANVHGGARYLRRMLQMFDGDIEKALAAYNAGPGAVRRYNGVPPFPETRAYVTAVLDYMASRTEGSR